MEVKVRVESSSSRGAKEYGDQRFALAAFDSAENRLPSRPELPRRGRQVVVGDDRL
jgi:hypothetical protein